MKLTVITKTIGALHGASQSGIDLILACNQTEHDVTVIHRYGSKIPNNIDYSKLSGLSNEVKSKFKLIRPKTLGQALRIDGITPAAAYILLSHVKKSNNKKRNIA